MLDIFHTNSFKRDLKKAKLQNKNFDKLDAVVEMLSNDPKKIPPKYRNHQLSGRWDDSWELHVQPDWLLVYKLEADCIILERLGSHSELFV